MIEDTIKTLIETSYDGIHFEYLLGYFSNISLTSLDLQLALNNLMRSGEIVMSPDDEDVYILSNNIVNKSYTSLLVTDCMYNG